MGERRDSEAIVSIDEMILGIGGRMTRLEENTPNNARIEMLDCQVRLLEEEVMNTKAQHIRLTAAATKAISNGSLRIEELKDEHLEFPHPQDDSRDPWNHRSRGMRCHSCMWFVIKVPDHSKDAPEFGRCRRRAPTMSGYPAVFGADWCGDHKLDEEKI